MRKHGRWMAHPDDRILEALDERGPLARRRIGTVLADAGVDMTYPAKYLEFRIATLLTHGLLERRADGRLSVTPVGREYLAGNLDAGTLDGDDESNEESGTDSPEFIV